jgi:hypothetical protein
MSQSQGGAPTPPYRHKEAYCLMKYASKDGEIVEWIWNSRDGVTPFGCMARDGQTELFHVEWHLDRCIPNYQPGPGERVFTSVTREDMERYVERLIEEHWDNGTYPMKARFKDEDDARAVLLRDALGDVSNGAPKVIFAREWDDPRPRPDQWRGPRNSDGSPKVRFA